MATKVNGEGVLSSKQALTVLIHLITDIAASVNGSRSDYTRPTQTTSLIDSGANETYTAPPQQLMNKKQPVSALQMATGAGIHTSLSGNVKISYGRTPPSLLAKNLPSFKPYLISVGQLAHERDITYTTDKVHITGKRDISPHANTIVTRKTNIVYKLQDVQSGLAAGVEKPNKKNRTKHKSQ